MQEPNDGQWEATGNAKWKKALQELGIDNTDTGLAPPTMDIELEGLENNWKRFTRFTNSEKCYHCALRGSSKSR